MKLSDLHPNDVSMVSPGPTSALKLSALSPADVSLIPPESEPSMLEAGARGLAQGATLGFGDEIYGAGSSAVSALKKGSLSDAVKDYISARDEVRKNNDRAKAAHPVAFGAGEIGGGLLPLAVTGVSAPALAGVGAAMGVGTSNSSNPVDLTKQAAIGGVTGYVGGKVAEAAAPLLSKATGPVSDAVSGVGDYISNKFGKGAVNAAVSSTGGLFDSSIQAAKQAAPKAASMVGDVASDAASAAVGGMLAGTPGAVAAPYVKRLVQKPLAAAVGGVSNLATGAIQTLARSNLFSSTQLAKIASSPYAQALKGAAMSGGPAALATAHYILQQTDPGYQKILKEEQE